MEVFYTTINSVYSDLLRTETVCNSINDTKSVTN